MLKRFERLEERLAFSAVSPFPADVWDPSAVANLQGDSPSYIRIDLRSAPGETATLQVADTVTNYDRWVGGGK